MPRSPGSSRRGLALLGSSSSPKPTGQRSLGWGTPSGTLAGAASPQGRIWVAERLRGWPQRRCGYGVCPDAATSLCGEGHWSWKPQILAPRLSFKDRLPTEGGATQPTQHHCQVPPASESVETVGCGDHPDGVEQGAPAQQRPIQLQHGLSRAQQMLEARVPVVAAWGPPFPVHPGWGLLYRPLPSS